MNAHLYIEGGGSDSKELNSRCREGFKKLLEKSGFEGRMPRLSACGGRNPTFADFKIASINKGEAYIAMWIDSEDPLTDIEAAWDHLKKRDKWDRPPGATDDQVLFMTTCMETWIVADHEILREHYGAKLKTSALPSLASLEQRGRHDVQEKLSHATRDCASPYAKGKRSFELLARLNPATLKKHLPSFVRTLRLLDAKLKSGRRPSS